jgi:hypothetical protein
MGDLRRWAIQFGWMFVLIISFALPQDCKASLPNPGTESVSSSALDPGDYSNGEQNGNELKGYPDLKAEMDARQLQPQTGTDPASVHVSLPIIPGMSQPRPGSSFRCSEGTPQTIAKQQNPTQPTGVPIGKVQCWANQYVGGYGPGPNKAIWLPQVLASTDVRTVPANFNAYGPAFTMGPLSDKQLAYFLIKEGVRAGSKLDKPDLSSMKAGLQGFTQQVGDQSGDSQKTAFQTALQAVSQGLINIANEENGTPIQGSGPRTISNAVWIVSQMYKNVYLPMAILLLLVGAILTQFGNTVKNGVSVFALMEEPDAFTGIIRGANALVLMAMVQLIVSWGIDIGNSMTYSVTNFVQMETIQNWLNDIYPDQSNVTPNQKAQNNAAETTMQSTTRAVFGTVQNFLNYGILVLIAYQTALVCYLFLLGPMAAAFYAWPGGIGSLFRPVFNNWLNALTNLVLWRFWWCAILLCMVVRINWLQDIGQYNPQSPFEPLVYTAYLVMLAYVPFHALEFRPGDLVDQMLQQAKVGTQQK